jgi:predicted acylesterase/phospholipase RssA/CRP-like cAMP-binding protein
VRLTACGYVSHRIAPVAEVVRPDAPELEVAFSGALAGLDEAARAALANAFEVLEIPEGEVLVRQGDPADRLYVVLDGHLGVAMDTAESGVVPVARAAAGDTASAQDLGDIGPGQVVGEVGVLSGTRRTATVTARSRVRVASLGKAELRRLTAAHPSLVEGLLASSVRRLRLGQLAAYLSTLFGAMPPQLLAALGARTEWVSVAGGETLFKPGDPGDSLYVVLSGRLRLIGGLAQQRIGQVEEIGRAQPIGTTNVLTGRPRMATAIAIRDTELANIPASTLRWFVESFPAASMPIMAELADRIERGATAAAYGASRAATFALVGGRGVEVGQFAAELEGVLRWHGRVAVLRSTDIEDLAEWSREQTPEGGAERADLSLPQAHWLDEREAAHDFVLYVTDGAETPWTEQCLRQADHVIVVADATEPPQPGPVEASLARRWSPDAAPRQTLVLLHSAETEEPSGTAGWLATRTVAQHLHVRRGNEADITRLGRLLAGRGITLVLGGGGARGYAHIGVVRVMEELGIPIDMVAGTSMGAIVASAVARGWSAAKILEQLSDLGRLFVPTLPIVSLTSGSNIVRAIDRIQGPVAIEDTWLPTFFVSTDLTHATPVIHRTGAMRAALRASSSLPGILPPVYDDGALLIDGGLLDTLPVGQMRERNGGGQVIAVDVSPPVDVQATRAFGDHLSGWRLLWNRMRHPRTRRELPGIVELIQRAVAVPGLYLRGQMSTSTPDVLIQPNVGRWRMLDFGQAEHIAQAGYDAALDPLREWWEQRQRAG